MKVDKSLLVPSLSGFQYGYNTSIIAGAILFITTAFALNPFQEGMVVGAAMIGICLASFSAILANYIGRKTTLFISVICFLTGTLISTFSPNYALLLVGRFIIGLGCGGAIVVAPTYLIEVAPPESRGGAANLNQVGIALGSLLAYLSSYLLSFSSSWRWMFALALIPAVVQFFGLFSIKESVEKTAELASSSWKNLIERSYLSRFKIVLLLTFLQALSGANAIFFFAPTVFENVGFVGVESSLLSTVFIGVVYLLSILVSFSIVDKFGRRFLLLTSFAGMGSCLLAIALVGFFQPPWLDTLSITCILLYIAFFALGVGPIPPIVINEISPLKVRAHAMTLMGAMGWVINYLIAISFLPMMKALSIEGTFMIYAFFCLLALILFFFKLPETKQKSLGEIERLFNSSG
ncbi:MAG: MFS transporter [Chlamydiales bacterium]